MNNLSKGLIGMGCVLCATLAMAADNPDGAFFKKAAEGGIAEVELGKLAQEKSSNPSVKDYGAMMVRDHSAANDKLKSLAETKGIELPTSPSAMQMGTKAKLEVLSGRDPGHRVGRGHHGLTARAAGVADVRMRGVLTLTPQRVSAW